MVTEEMGDAALSELTKLSDKMLVVAPLPMKA
jgi:hypothetical protein